MGGKCPRANPPKGGCRGGKDCWKKNKALWLAHCPDEALPTELRGQRATLDAAYAARLKAQAKQKVGGAHKWVEGGGKAS